MRPFLASLPSSTGHSIQELPQEDLMFTVQLCAPCRAETDVSKYFLETEGPRGTCSTCEQASAQLALSPLDSLGPRVVRSSHHSETSLQTASLRDTPKSVSPRVIPNPVTLTIKQAFRIVEAQHAWVLSCTVRYYKTDYVAQVRI